MDEAGVYIPLASAEVVFPIHPQMTLALQSPSPGHRAEMVWAATALEVDRRTVRGSISLFRYAVRYPAPRWGITMLPRRRCRLGRSHDKKKQSMLEVIGSLLQSGGDLRYIQAASQDPCCSISSVQKQHDLVSPKGGNTDFVSFSYALLIPKYHPVELLLELSSVLPPPCPSFCSP